MLQMLGMQTEVDVVGTSYGGMVAFRTAQQYPEFVNKLVICSSGICMSLDNNEPLLKKHGMLHISQMLVPEKVFDLRAAVASATFKTRGSLSSSAKTSLRCCMRSIEWRGSSYWMRW